MSLQIWLPFTGNLKNNGLQHINLVNNNVTVDSNGKIGECYSFTGSNQYMTATNVSIPTTTWSMCAWIYPQADTSSGHQYIVGLNTNSSGDFLGVLAVYSNKLTVRVGNTSYAPMAYSLNTWYHLAAVYDGTLNIYVNGELKQTVASPQTPVAASTLYIGIRGGNFGQFIGKMNDIRIYDHALSLAEIKEISKGLCVHYKLDEFYSTDNLIINGMGELGTENWTTSSRSTTEIPSGHSEIKASFYSGNMTKHYIPIIKNHSYTISGYIKAMANQSGSKYPSIYPYDIDKKFIENHMCADGFNNTYKTTLAQPLHKGDTIVYATDLSAWTTSTSNYYYFCAVFGYKNSYGDVYPDMVYTHDTPKFGTYSDKSHIDKTNNTITLDSPFTGEDRPAGTTICQATQGSTYYYPWSGIPVTSISDWTFKTKTLTPATTNRLKAAAYIRWSTYGGVYIAGNKLVDNTFNDTQITDSSGYGNHGTKSGNISISENTPRYSMSTVFDGSTSYIEADPLPLETATISIWVKTSWLTTSTYKHIMFDKQSGLSMAWGASNGNFITYIGSSAGGSGSCIDIRTTTYTVNQWNHIVVVKTGTTTRDVYVNGIKATPASNNWWSGDQYTLNLGVRHAGGVYKDYFDGQLSDFRAYTTQLSADDILALYNVGAKVSNKNEMLSYEMKEG